jgi:hypothetical protein
VKPVFSQRTMDIGTFEFNFMRTLMVTCTGGAEINECFLTIDRIKDNDPESWVREWASMAERVHRSATAAVGLGQPITARQAYLRASNYYRSAMFSLPHTDARLDWYLTASRDCFHEAAKLFSPRIEAVEIPFGDARLPAYFLSASSHDSAPRPTLLVLNGGDSTNEEMVHWLGFAAAARGWNCMVFEGPGQWSALQMNPGLFLRPDYEAPVRVIIDYLVQRGDVDRNKIALLGRLWDRPWRRALWLSRNGYEPASAKASWWMCTKPGMPSGLSCSGKLRPKCSTWFSRGSKGSARSFAGWPTTSSG